MPLTQQRPSNEVYLVAAVMAIWKAATGCVSNSFY